MTVKTSRFNIKSTSPVQKVYSGKFDGANGANPSTYTLDNGITVTRSGEGVFVLTLPSPMKAFKSVCVTANAALATGFHHISWSTSDSARTITITHNTCAYTDIATAPAANDVTVQINFIAVVEGADVPGSGI
jgi:hypothetical protein